jgi:hypothetical protein
LIIFIVSKLNAQTFIKGAVLDTSGKPIPGASVISTGNNPTGAIKAFAITDNSGRYEIQLNNFNGDSVFIKVSCIGHQQKILSLKNHSQFLDIHLKQDFKKLMEVKVKNLPVYVSNDTLNYDVSKFKSGQDRVINDVLKKMPGMEVFSNGQINYQGKPIQQLTVDGLNLMEGQYGLISKNLNADAVSKVQVVENDQRVKILDSLVPSNQTTINLKLKKYAVSGVAEIGGGSSPVLRTINLTPMLFNKKTQMVNSFMSNNIGDDGAEQLETLLVARSLRNGNDFKLTRITGIITASVPPFERRRWLNNNLNQWSSNCLHQLKNDWIIKLNIAYINDYRRQITSGITTVYPQEESAITISEARSNSFNINRVIGNLGLEKNTRKIFLRNIFSANNSWNSDLGSLQKNTAYVHQISTYHSNYINNRLTLTTAIGKQLVTFNSFLSYGVSPEQLQISPGPFEIILSNRLPYKQAIQYVKSYGFFTDNNLGVTKKLGGIVLGAKAGMLLSQTNLESHLDTYQLSNEIHQNDSLSNNLRLSRTIFYSNLNSSYEFSKGFVSLEMPLKFLILGIQNIGKNEMRRLLIQPSLYSEYKIKNNFKTFATINRADTFITDPSTIYNSYILTNYRTLQKYPSIFARTLSLQGNVGFEYKNPLKGLFLALNYEAEHTRMNVLFNTFISPDGTSTAVGNQLPNYQIKHALSVNASKLIAPINTIFKLSTIGLLYEYERILNGARLKPGNKVLVLQSSVINNSSKIFSASYNGNFSFTKSYSGDSNTRKLFQHDHHLEANLFIGKLHTMQMNYDRYIYDHPGYRSQQFLDISYRFSLPVKRKTDVEIKCNNLFNRNVFASYYSDGYTTIENTFLLRKRQLIMVLRVRF